MDANDDTFDEILCAVAEFFQLSADLVKPGQGIKRKRAREELMEMVEGMKEDKAVDKVAAKGKAADKVGDMGTTGYYNHITQILTAGETRAEEEGEEGEPS